MNTAWTAASHSFQIHIYFFFLFGLNVIIRHFGFDKFIITSEFRWIFFNTIKIISSRKNTYDQHFYLILISFSIRNMMNVFLSCTIHSWKVPIGKWDSVTLHHRKTSSWIKQNKKKHYFQICFRLKSKGWTCSCIKSTKYNL